MNVAKKKERWKDTLHTTPDERRFIKSLDIEEIEAGLAHFTEKQTLYKNWVIDATRQVRHLKKKLIALRSNHEYPHR